MSTLMGLLFLVVPGWCRAADLDKTWTTGFDPSLFTQRTLEKKEPANTGSSAAEGAGFEPAEVFTPRSFSRRQP